MVAFVLLVYVCVFCFCFCIVDFVLFVYVCFLCDNVDIAVFVIKLSVLPCVCYVVGIVLVLFIACFVWFDAVIVLYCSVSHC